MHGPYVGESWRGVVVAGEVALHIRRVPRSSQQGVTTEHALWAAFLAYRAEAHPRPATAAEVLVWVSNGGDLATVVPREMAVVTAKQLGKRFRDHFGGPVTVACPLIQGRPTREKTNTWVVTRAEGAEATPTSRARAGNLAALRAVQLVLEASVPVVWQAQLGDGCTGSRTPVLHRCRCAWRNVLCGLSCHCRHCPPRPFG